MAAFLVSGTGWFCVTLVCDGIGFNLPGLKADEGEVMSAPQTNLERQKRRHRGPLIGMAVGLIVVGILFVLFLGDTSNEDGTLIGEGAQKVAPEAAGTTAPAAGGFADTGPEPDADTIPESEAGVPAVPTREVDDVPMPSQN
jgi:hypothetical protein